MHWRNQIPEKKRLKRGQDNDDKTGVNPQSYIDSERGSVRDASRKEKNSMDGLIKTWKSR